MRRGWIGLALGCLLALLGAESALAQTKVLIYSGTVGYRHANATEAIQPAVVDLIQSKLQAAGITSDYRSCNGAGTGAGTLPGCQNATVGNPAIFTASNLAQYDAIFFWQASSRDRDDTTGERLFTDARAGRDRAVRPRRRRHRGDARLRDDGRRPGHVAVVGRAGRQRDRRADAGPLGDRREQHRDRPGVRPQPPVDQGPAGQLPVRRRALHVLLERPRHAPRADDARRGDLQRRHGRHPDGRRPSDRVVPDVRGRADLGLEPRALLRRLPGERRRQQPDQAPRRRRPLRRGHARARTPTAARPCGRTSAAPCWPTTSRARSAWTSRATARSTGPRSATRRSSPRAGCGCTTRRRARRARC